MKNAVGYLVEPLLSQFFLIDAICRGFIGEEEKKGIFEELAKLFCVPLNSETEQYYTVANSDQYKNIVDYSSYERLCRTIEFAEVSGQHVELTKIDRVILAQKRESMKVKSEIFKQSKNLTADIIVDTLLDTSMNGNVDAMVTLSYMEYHGICICKDSKNAVKRLALCAKWNSLFGNLMGIAYDSRNKEDYYNILFTILRSSNQREVFKYICEYTSFENECTKSPVARIIEKAFGLGIIRRNVYDQIFAKVAFSSLISCEDKEKLLLNKKKDAIVSLSDIPFDVNRDKLFSFDCAKAQNIPLRREEELHKIFCSISPATSNRSALYQPLLVAGDDEYIQDMYVDALKAGFAKKNKVFEVDAGTLSVQDFAGSKENFLLRGLSETKESHTVFLVKHCENIGDSEQEELQKLLDYEYRRKFKLLEPTVSLDMSDVLIVLFASEVTESVRRLAKECDVVWTRRINDDEKQTVIDSTFDLRSKSFGIRSAKMDDACKRFLIPFKTGQIIRIIDGALKKAAYDNEKVITAESLKTITAQQNIIRSKREFGYALDSTEGYVVDDFQMKKLEMKNWLPGGEKISFVQDDTKNNYSQGLFLSNYVTILAKEFIGSRDNYVSAYQDEIREICSVMFGCTDEQSKKLMDSLISQAKNEWGDLAWSYVWNVGINPWGSEDDALQVVSNWLKKAVNEAGITNYNETTIDAAGKDLADLLLALVVNHPNYFTTAIMNGSGLGAAHYPELCYSWLASMDNNYTEGARVEFNNGGYRVVRINCAVDVDVYDDNGNKIASIENEQPNTTLDEENGNIEYYICSKCGDIFADEAATTEINLKDTVIAKDGHNYGDAYVNNEEDHWKACECGNVVDKSAHNYGEWSVVKEATATEKGIKEKVCSVCGFKVTEDIPVVTDNADADETDKDNISTDSPATGDTSNIILWISLLILSGIGIFLTIIFRRKQVNN